MNTHWKVYWTIKKHIPKKLCSNLIKIDSFKIYKPGQTGGFQVQPLEIIAKPMPDHLQINYRKQKTSPYIIQLINLNVTMVDLETILNVLYAPSVCASCILLKTASFYAVNASI